MSHVTTAKEMLGDDFLSPDEVLFDSNFIGRQHLLDRLHSQIPDEHTLQWLAQNQFILLPTGFEELTFLRIKDQFEGVTFPRQSSFEEECVRKNRWLAIRKMPHPEEMVSFKYGSLVYEDEAFFMPNALTLIYAAAVYFQVRQESLFDLSYITSSSLSCGRDYNRALCVHTYCPRDYRSLIPSKGFRKLVIEATSSWMSERPMYKGVACARMW